MHFGATLRLLRMEAGISLRDLAGRIGVSGAYLSRVENGHDGSPTPDRLIAIADALGLPRAVLVELARQAGPAVDGYLQRTPEAGSLFLDIARRGLQGPQIARIKAFLDAEFPLPAGEVQTHRLVDLLPASRVVIGVSCSDLEDLVSVAASRLGDEVDARVVVQRVLAREREQPTAIGGGFAVLHVALEPKAEPVVETAVMLTLAQPFALATPDQRAIRVVFLLIYGPDRRARLELVTRVARLASYDIADELCAAASAEQARAIVERVESLW
ncbi:helix-turn-helix domain-containing protein [Nannocystaceae bacterium ST9]